jgi:hypothetical protein
MRGTITIGRRSTLFPGLRKILRQGVNGGKTSRMKSMIQIYRLRDDLCGLGNILGARSEANNFHRSVAVG